MRTRSSNRRRSKSNQQQQLTPVIVEVPELPMADNQTMAQMLQAPIEGYEDAIVVPPINANNFELKQTLINLVQSLLHISKKVTRSENYSSWKRSIMIALNAKNKMKLVNGEFPEPTMESNLRAMWERNNDMLISWILI
ncbi:reverse transcriptase domain-containing protein [Tanacetum coccineum]